MTCGCRPTHSGHSDLAFRWRTLTANMVCGLFFLYVAFVRLL